VLRGGGLCVLGLWPELDGLSRLQSTSGFWGRSGPAIAHLFLSFGFGDDRLAISIEARKEKGEGCSSAKGFFRH